MGVRFRHHIRILTCPPARSAILGSTICFAGLVAMCGYTLSLLRIEPWEESAIRQSGRKPSTMGVGSPQTNSGVRGAPSDAWRLHPHSGGYGAARPTPSRVPPGCWYPGRPPERWPDPCNDPQLH
jgi:hypothetical protein